MKDDEFMVKLQTIERMENKAQLECISAQKKYLAELKRRHAMIKKGEAVDVSDILKLLQNSGIIDENGNFVKKYKAVT